MFKRKFDVGDKCLVVRSEMGNDRLVGKVVTIEKVEDEDYEGHIFYRAEEDSSWFTDEDLKIPTPLELELL